MPSLDGNHATVAGLAFLTLPFLYCIGWSLYKSATAGTAAVQQSTILYLRKSVSSFFLRRRASPRILALGTLLASGLALIAFGQQGRTGTTAEFFASLNANHWLFLVYLCFFIAQWLVYFSSRDEKAAFQVRTLRSLLNETSGNWKAHSPEDRFHLNEAYRTKALTSITAVAVLVATAAVVLSVCAQIILTELQASNAQTNHFRTLCIYAATASALVSSLAFIVSVDALETVHNWFENESVRGILLPYFYRATINPKYVGFVLLMTSLVLLAAWIHPALGSIGFVSLVGSGHTYWFPSFDDAPGTKIGRALFLIPGIILPAALAVA
jgi:protein-S-isoprenylcysteine O-methyltransferase Ste14